MGATTGYLFARADWDDYDVGAPIRDDDRTPFIDVTGLTFGVNAFNSAEALIAYSEGHPSVEAFFATCDDTESYGALLEHHSFIFTTKAYNSYATANFNSLYLSAEGAVADLDFEGAAVKFLGTSLVNEYTMYLGYDSDVDVTKSSNMTVIGSVYISNKALLDVLSGSQFTAGAVTIGYGGNLLIEDSTFNASSISANSSASITMRRASFNTTGKVDLGYAGTISVEGSTISASSITMGGGSAKLSIISDSVNGSPSNVTLGTIDFGWGTTNSIETDWKSTVTFHEIANCSMAGKIIIDLTGIDTSAEQTNTILNYTGTGDAPNYETLLGTQAWNAATSYDPRDSSVAVTGYTVTSSGSLAFSKLYGKVYVSEANGNDETASPDNPYFETFSLATGVKPTNVVVTDGNYDTDNAPTFNGIETTILNGTFATSVCGGKVFDAGGEVSGNISFLIAGGTFSKLVFAGDRVNGGVQQTRTGNLTTTITNGEFNSAVAGAMLVTGLTTPSLLTGNVELTINGGTFNSSSWIYGGSLATKKIYGGQTTINGNVTVTLDATNNAITVSNLVVGSYGYGSIKENATLVLTGNHNINATGEIWGGCSGDFITIRDGKRVMEESKVDGKRILSFTGFSGTLASGLNKIRAFSDIEFKDGSEAKLGGCINLSDTTNWSFENGSSLTGAFINDFEGDTLKLDLKSGLSSPWDIITSSREEAFSGFGDIGGAGDKRLKVFVGTNELRWESDDARYAGSGYALALIENGTTTTMQLSTIA